MTSPRECRKCGQRHERCSAHNRAGGPCGRHPMKGQRVCSPHGGKAPNALAAAKRRVATAEALRIVEADAQARLACYIEEGITDPLEQLARLTAEAMAMKDALAARVNTLTDLRYEDDKGSEQLRAEVALYERALDRTQKFLVDIVRLGLDERMTRLSEAQGAALVAVVVAILRRVGTDPDDPGVRAICAEEFRRVSRETGQT